MKKELVVVPHTVNLDHVGRSLFQTEPYDDDDEIVGLGNLFVQQNMLTGLDEPVCIADGGDVEGRETPYQRKTIVDANVRCKRVDRFWRTFFRDELGRAAGYRKNHDTFSVEFMKNIEASQ